MQKKKIAVPSRSEVCPICGGTMWRTYDAGVIPDYGLAHPFAEPCEKCRAKYRSADETGVPSEYCEAGLEKFDFGAYSSDTKNMEKIAHDFLDNFETRWEAKKVGLYLWSEKPGSGKTFLLCCLARSVMIKYDLQMRFVTASDYIAAIGDSFKRESGEHDRSQVYRDCRLLVLDDLGAEKKGDWQESEIFRLINGRLNQGKVTMFSSNMPPWELRVNSRMVSRIRKASIVLRMPEESIRDKQSDARQAEFLKDILGEK